MMKKSQFVSASLVSFCILLQSTSAFPFHSARRTAQPIAMVPTDGAGAVVESTIKRNPTGESFKGWGYAKALYLYGQYLVYLRTKDRRYLNHIQSWVDQHIDEKGTINRPINSLDYIMPGNLLLILYKETRQ